MIIVRLVAYIFLCLSVMILGAEGLRFLEGDNEGWLNLAQVINFLNSSWINLEQSMLAPLANLAAFFTFMGVFIVLILVSRRRY